MKLYVPACGDRIVLSKDWTFTLYNERRNWEFAKSQDIEPNTIGWTNYGSPFKDITLPAGTTLEVDRVYIRIFSKAAASKEDDFDSITFRVVEKKTKRRFWAKLADCNNIEFRNLEVETFKDRHAREQAEAALQPKRLDADLIREAAQDGKLERFVPDLLVTIQTHFDSSMKLQHDEYKAYVADRQAANASSNRYGFRYHSHIDSYKELTLESMVWAVKRLTSDTCRFSKQANGTNVRKFMWTWKNEVAYHWSYETPVDRALQGLYVNVVTNADDTEIINVHMCADRMPKGEKKKDT